MKSNPPTLLEQASSKNLLVGFLLDFYLKSFVHQPFAIELATNTSPTHLSNTKEWVGGKERRKLCL